MTAMNARAMLALLLAASSCAQAMAKDRFDGVRAYIHSELQQKSIPSVAVAVAKDGKIIWEEGFGWADREKRIPATAHSMYPLASITKPMTATGLMLLVDAGKLDLDKPANDYLGYAKLRSPYGDADKATLRRIANHTSGLPLGFQFFYADEPFRSPTRDETILRYGHLVTRPGERVQYSNMGFGVLDYVIERTSGMRFADYMRTQVFLPLGMTRTSLDVGPGLEPFAVTTYDGDGLPLPWSDSDMPGAGSVYSSAHDLVRFGMFHLKAHLPDQKAILSDAVLDQMHARTSDKGFRDMSGFNGFGIGFAVSPEAGRNSYVGHNGGTAGGTSDMRLLPQHGLAVVVVSNSSNMLPPALADRIIAAMVPGWETRDLEKLAPPPRPAFVSPPELVGDWQGDISTYVGDIPVRLSFKQNGDVHGKVGDQPTTLVDQPRFDKGVFTGWLSARIDTPDARRYPHLVRFDLTLRGDVLDGDANAHTDRKGPRLRNVLSHWVQVRRTGKADAP